MRSGDGDPNTQNAGLMFGGNPVKDKPHGLPLCWVACGGVMVPPRIVPARPLTVTHSSQIGSLSSHHPGLRLRRIVKVKDELGHLHI
jgi:hypothetical protein